MAYMTTKHQTPTKHQTHVLPVISKLSLFLIEIPILDFKMAGVGVELFITK